MNPLLLPILDIAAKGTALLLLAFGLLSVWRGASASQRSLVWLLCFAALLLLPLTMVTKPLWPVPVGSTTQQSLHTVPLVLEDAAVAAIPAPVPDVPGAMATQSMLSALTPWHWLAMSWALGATLVLSSRLVGNVRLWLLNARGAPCTHTHACAEARHLAEQAGIRRPISLRVSREIQVPMTWGTVRPVLLLPESALSWSAENLTAALRHELGHVRHGDAFGRWMMTMACAVYWMHPLVWMAARRWRIAQEQASDDLVVTQSESPENYAMLLLNAARHAQGQQSLRHLPVLTMALPTTLETRLTAIMDDSTNRHPVRRGAMAAGTAVSMLALLTCACLQLQAASPAPSPAAASPSPALEKAHRIIIPTVSFAQASVDDAIKFLRHKAKENDPAKTGVEIQLIPDGRQASLTLDLKDVPLSEALRYVAELAGMELVPDKNVIIIRPVPNTAATPGGETVKKIPAMVRAQKIILPQVNFPNSTVEEAMEYLRAKAKEHDAGLQLILEPGGRAATISMDLKSVPLSEAIRYLADLAEREISSDLNSIRLRPKVPRSTPATPAPAGGTKNAATSPAAEKAARIILPRVQFQQASVEESVEYLRVRSLDLDPDRKGVNIILAKVEKTTPTITLDLKDVPLSEALRYVTELAGMELSGSGSAFVIAPAKK